MENDRSLNENLQIINEKDLKNASAILALLHGKSDSICRLFHKEITVNKADLSNLNALMIDKLSLHNVSSISTTIDISFSNKKVLSFKSWNEFESCNFDSENSVTKSIYVQWDFFVSFPGYQIPQRHTVNVRIASTPNPSDLFKALLGGGFDDEDDIEFQSCTMICKVDFVNNTLAEEILHVAEKWNEQIETAYSKNGNFRIFLFKHRNGLAITFESLSLISLSFILAIVWKMNGTWRLFEVSIYSLAYLLISLLPISVLFKRITHFFGKRIYNSLSNLLDSHVFAISRGDAKKQEKISKSLNFKKDIVAFILNALFSIVLSYVFFILK